MEDVQQLLTATGPFASVMLNAPSAIDNADRRLEREWANARKSLTSAEMSDSLMDSLDATISELHHDGGAAVVVLQPSEGEALVEYLDDPLEHELAVVGPLPRLGPILESRQQTVAHLVVVTDRAGADIISFDSGAETDLTEVEGETEHLQRSNPGGWSQRRFQQRAENQWESNAAEVAEQVVAAAKRVDARLITVAGDVRAVTFLLEHLPEEAGRMTVKLEGQSDDLIAEETAREAANVVAEDKRAVMEQHREAVGQDRSPKDVSGVLEALTNGQVQVLLVHDDPSDDRMAQFDRDGIWCSTVESGTETATPGAELAEGRLVDVAIRSALMSDARVQFVPKHGGPEGQLGALLRW